MMKDLYVCIEIMQTDWIVEKESTMEKQALVEFEYLLLYGVGIVFKWLRFCDFIWDWIENVISWLR